MLGVWGGEAGGRPSRRSAGFCSPHAVCRRWDFSRAMHTHEPNPQKGGERVPLPPPTHPLLLPPPQASQLGVYRAFVDNYGVAMETAEKCCQANAQFAEISEVMMERRERWDDTVQARVLPLPPTVSSHAPAVGLWDGSWENKVEQIEGWG